MFCDLKNDLVILLLYVCCYFDVPETCKAYVKDGSVQTTGFAATLKQKLQIRFDISPSHNLPTLGHPVLVLTLQSQAPGRVATRIPMFKSCWFDYTSESRPDNALT